MWHTVIGELAHHDVREQTRPGHAPVHRPGRRQHLRDRPAPRAGQLRADVAHHVEGARLVVQNLRDVLTNLSQASATGRAAACALRGVNDGASRQVHRQLAQPWPGLWLSLLGSLLSDVTLDFNPSSGSTSAGNSTTGGAAWPPTSSSCACPSVSLERPHFMRRRYASSTFILSMVNCAIFKASCDRRTSPRNAALLVTRSANVMAMTLPAVTLSRNGTVPSTIAVSATPPSAVATCVQGAANRSLRAALRAAQRSARRCRSRPAARRSGPAQAASSTGTCRRRHSTATSPGRLGGPEMRRPSR